MGAETDVLGLMGRAQFMRQAMTQSQTISDSMITILSSFDHRLSTLEAAMRPTQVQCFSVCLSEGHNCAILCTSPLLCDLIRDLIDWLMYGLCD